MYARPFSSDPRLAALKSDGEALCEVYVAHQNGVPVQLGSVAAGLGRVNDRIAAILAADYPDLHAEMRDEERATRAAKALEDEATLLSVRFAVRQRAQWIADDAVASLPRRATPLPAPPLPDVDGAGVPIERATKEYQNAIGFGLRSLGIPRHKAPRVRLVPAGAISKGRAVGLHSPKRNTIFLDAGLTPNQMTTTIFHELAHHYDNLKGWLPGEAFALQMERDLFERWETTDLGRTYDGECEAKGCAERTVLAYCHEHEWLAAEPMAWGGAA